MNTKIFNEVSELYLLWRKALLGKSGQELREIAFIQEIIQTFQGQLGSIIDLGGGVGTHAVLLQEAGHQVTIYDRSQKALNIAKTRAPALNLIHGNFENIDVGTDFDSAICMWSSLSYVDSEVGRQNFYSWMSTHTRHIIVLDQPNFYLYPQNFNKVYEAENEKYAMKVFREWSFDEQFVKRTNYKYEIFDKQSGRVSIEDDQEEQHYVSVDHLQRYLGELCYLQGVYGGYSTLEEFDSLVSERMIAVYVKS